VFLDRGGGTTHDGLCALVDVYESETLGTFMVCLIGAERLEVVWGIVRLTTNETAEEGGDDGLRDNDLVVNRSPLKVEELHANRLGLEDMADMVRVDSVLTDEPLEDVETLWGELVNAALLKEVG